MKKLFIFIIGFIMAGYTGYKIGYNNSKKIYENLADEEIKTVKEHLIKYYTKNPSQNDISKNNINKKENIKQIEDNGNKIDYGKIYRTETVSERIPGHPVDSDLDLVLKKEETDAITKPYIITADDFHDSEYECVTLLYFQDKVLTDDDYNQINNIGIVGGYPILDQMGLFEPSDCLYVRDDKNGIDYEILSEERKFSKIKPHMVVDIKE